MALVERREIQYNKPSEGRAAHIRAALSFLLGTIGFSIPGAFAAKLLNPDKKVLAVCGDGGFMMNSQELEQPTARKCLCGLNAWTLLSRQRRGEFRAKNW